LGSGTTGSPYTKIVHGHEVDAWPFVRPQCGIAVRDLYARYDIIAGEIAPFGGMKESGLDPDSSGSRGLEIRHRGVSRGQIPVHGRHRPL